MNYLNAGCSEKALVVSIVLFLSGMISANPVLPPGVWVSLVPPAMQADKGSHSGAIGLDPTNRSTLYWGRGNDAGGPYVGLFKSTDGGSTWNRIGKIPPAFGGATDILDNDCMVKVDPRDPQHLYGVVGVRGANGFFVSYDGGVNFAIPQGWKDASTAGGFGNDCYDIAVDPVDFSHILVSFHSAWGDNGSGVVESKDAGNTWIVHAPQGNWGSGHSINFLYDPVQGIGNNRTWLLQTQYNAMWRTSDAGTTWTKVSDGVIQHGGGNVYYASNGTLYSSGTPRNLRSIDNGITWTEIGPNGGYNYIIGDGAKLYTMACFSTSGFITSPESDGANWTNYNSQTFSQGVYMMQFDPVNRILYSGNWSAGLWALKVEATKPIVQLVGAPVSVTYERGQSWTQQNLTVTAVNLARGSGIHLSGQVTVSKKSSWLTASVNALNADSQVITNTIDPSSFADADAHYYDTVTVHAAGAEVVDQTYLVSVWVRQPPTLAAFTIVPSDSGSVPSSKPFRFSVDVFDQYGQPLTQQPAITWSATGGTITQSGVFTPSASSTEGRVMVSAQGNAGVADTARFAIVRCTQGLAYDYFSHTWIAGISSFPSTMPEQTGTSANISLQPASAQDSFALRFTGYVMIPASGSYTFYTSSDDGSALFIDGNKVVDNDGIHAQQERSGSLTLNWGLHAITVLYFEQNGGQGLAASWQGPGIAKAAIPDSMLFHDGGTTLTRSDRSEQFEGASRSIRVVKSNLVVSVHPNESWTLGLFALNGAKIRSFVGTGAGIAGSIDPNALKGFVIAKLKISGSETVTKAVYR